MTTQEFKKELLEKDYRHQVINGEDFYSDGCCGTIVVNGDEVRTSSPGGWFKYKNVDDYKKGNYYAGSEYSIRD